MSHRNETLGAIIDAIEAIAVVTGGPLGNALRLLAAGGGIGLRLALSEGGTTDSLLEQMERVAPLDTRAEDARIDALIALLPGEGWDPTAEGSPHFGRSQRKALIHGLF